MRFFSHKTTTTLPVWDECTRYVNYAFTCMTSSIEQEWNITTLSFEEDPEPFGKERDGAIQMLAKEAGVEVIVKTSHTLYDLQKCVSFVLHWGFPGLFFGPFPIKKSLIFSQLKILFNQVSIIYFFKINFIFDNSFACFGDNQNAT